MVGTRDERNDTGPRSLRERARRDTMSSTGGIEGEDVEPSLGSARVHAVRELTGSEHARPERHENPDDERKDAMRSGHLSQLPQHAGQYDRGTR